MEPLKIPLKPHHPGGLCETRLIWVPVTSDSEPICKNHWLCCPVDECIADYVDALIQKSVWTTASCCGHGLEEAVVSDAGTLPKEFIKLRPKALGKAMEIRLIPENLDAEIHRTRRKMSSRERDKAKKRVDYARQTAAGWRRFSILATPEIACMVQDLIDERRNGGTREDELFAILKVGTKFRHNSGDSQKIQGEKAKKKAAKKAAEKAAKETAEC